MDVPFFDPTSLPFPEGIEKITRKIDPSPIAELNQQNRTETNNLKNTFSVNSPETPPSASFNNNDFFSTTNYPHHNHNHRIIPPMVLTFPRIPLQLHTVPSNNNSQPCNPSPTLQRWPRNFPTRLSECKRSSNRSNDHEVCEPARTHGKNQNHHHLARVQGARNLRAKSNHQRFLGRFEH